MALFHLLMGIIESSCFQTGETFPATTRAAAETRAGSRQCPPPLTKIPRHDNKIIVWCGLMIAGVIWFVYALGFTTA